MNTIIKTLRSEINIKKSQAEKNGRISEENELYYVGRFDLCHELLSVLDTLQEQPVKNNALFDSCLAKVNPETREEVRKNIDKMIEQPVDFFGIGNIRTMPIRI